MNPYQTYRRFVFRSVANVAQFLFVFVVTACVCLLVAECVACLR